MRIGIGYDIHPLVEGRQFVLGGEILPASFGPLGHSDGDVLIHAIIDSLLGALGLGDIGTWFPDSDKQYKDVRSVELLSHVIAEVRLKGWQIGNVDSIVILERPKLAPSINRIRTTLASALGIEPSLISIKAKTNEGIGDIGKGEAIAAWATTLLLKLS